MTASPASTRVPPGGDGPPPVTVVGAGMAGVACAVALRAAGRQVRIVDRGRAVGGRMASPELHGRRVDIGAGYFTAKDEGFVALVRQWESAGLARPWTSTFGVLAPGRAPEEKAGPVRWATPGGLRSLVRALLGPVPFENATAVDVLPAGEVVLAMPDPQAARLVRVPDAVDYRPVIAVVCEFTDHDWPFADAAFVNDHPDVDFVADDGARRGDGAPVLVAHTTPVLAARHLDDPDGVVAPVIAALRELLGVGAPIWTHAHRWTFAKPADAHPAAFGRIEEGGRTVWLAGDQWCPEGSPRVESAWRSGTDLAAAILTAGPSL
ncbi:putative NAD/FAD-dependent oxidoreductase [Nakamurella sp. UYEF19]|uniref:NAD(P)/FAD-dependent oxidoreductase n=1 Tax=Nakamurella sp. UYEF19 TaxID=1756392 RepID=UPI00339271B2